MEKLAEEGGQVTVIGSNQMERRSVRRRLVQSTLFPHRPPEVESTGDQKCDNCNEENRNSEDEEYCGSQGKKTRRRKGKSTPQDGASKKMKKSPAKITPKKNGTNNGSITANSIENEDLSTPIPNLRLEAKLRAEENSRLFAGKKMHPFFSSRKTGKKIQEVSETESNHLVEKKDKNFLIGPIHVFEKMQDDVTSIDWKNWTFCEKTRIDTTCGLEGSFTLVLKDLVNAFISNGFPSMLDPSDVTVAQEKVGNPCLIQQDSFEKLPIAPTTIVDEQVACCQLLGESEWPLKVDEVVFLSGHTDDAIKPDSERLNIFFDESNQLEDILWTDKYQPKKSSEVCGNAESVRSMNEWLRLWHEQGFRAMEDSSNGDKHNTGDSDYIYNGYDSDSANVDEWDNLKNVLLVTGPVGSGKSAAIHACAREQGFRILESNASECRNGPAVKQKFGEALESHCLTRSLENAVDSYNTIESAQVVNDEAVYEDDNKVTELIPRLDKEENHGASRTYGKILCMESENGNNQTKVRPLIIVEDVDISFQDDRGFVAAIKQIAERAKGPLILTSNDKNPVLPDNLDRLELSFSMPSSKELLCHLSKICAAEKIDIQPHLIEQLSEYYQGDIRKTIMHLQFWCQSRRHRTVDKLHKNYGPLLFDLDASHRILPKVISWDLPSQLSELIQKEITEALLLMEGNSRKVDNEDTTDRLGIQNIRTDYIELKKERLLRRNYSFIASSEIPSDTRNQNSPPGKNIMRKRKLVVSSDSEDEILNDRYHVASDKIKDNNLFLEDDSRFPSDYPKMEHDTNLLTNVPLCFEAEKFVENHCCSEMGNGNSWLNQICNSVDISCVPESSYVPETEINNETEVLSRTVSYCNVAETCDAIAELSEEESLDDFDDNDVVSVSGVFQVMDECSRIDFKRRSEPMEKLEFRINKLVQESWKKLRDNCNDLKEYVASEPKHALQLLEHTYGMCNVISEADLLLSNCRNKDPLELSNNEQLEMASTMAQHRFCIYARDVSSCQPNIFSQTNEDFGGQMLTSKTNTTALRWAVEEEVGLSNTLNDGQVSEASLEKCEIAFGRHPQCSENISCLVNIIKSLVSPRASLAVKGDGFHEYVSALGTISRSDASRHSEGVDNGRTQRSRRAARHYLSTGALSLSPEDISLLSQYSMYRKATS